MKCVLLLGGSGLALVVALLITLAGIDESGRATAQQPGVNPPQRKLEEERRRADQARAEAEEQRQRAEAKESQAQRLFYWSMMSQAQQAWEQQHMHLLRQILLDTATYPDRGFEWYYWQRQAHLPVKRSGPASRTLTRWPFPRMEDDLSPPARTRRRRSGICPQAGNSSRSPDTRRGSTLRPSPRMGSGSS